MNNSKEYTLDQIIDIDSLQDIQDTFAKMSNLSTVTVDRIGTPISSPSNFTKFCRLIRTSEEGCKRCKNCDAEGGFKSMYLKKPTIYTCHVGLTDLSAPIIVNDNFLGSMLCGQVTIKENNSKILVNLKKISIELNLPYDDLLLTLKEVNSLEYEKIQAAADFLYQFTNLIAEMGMANIIQFELLEETKERMKFQQLATDTKIKSLHAQINPHFLFNTLNTIASMALIEDAPNTQELIYALSDILRYNLKNSENMVALSTEITNIEKYLFIQTSRYSDRIKYELNIPSKIMNCRIPVMTLQPILENAIIHGLEPKKEGGKLNIVAKFLFDKYIIIEVSDNGIGMSAERLQYITSNTNSSSKNVGLGIQNVEDRLKYYFGPEFGLSIKSQLYIGTSVYIKIPFIK